MPPLFQPDTCYPIHIVIYLILFYLVNSPGEDTHLVGKELNFSKATVYDDEDEDDFYGGSSFLDRLNFTSS